MPELINLIKDFAEILKHSSALAAVLGAGGGGAIGWYIKHRNWKTGNFRSRIEIIGVEPVVENGQVILEYASMGKQMDLSELFPSKLEKKIIAGTRKAGKGNGILRLANGRDHRWMMDMIEEHLTGPDPEANMDAVMGRQDDVLRNHVAFCPTYYFEDSDSSLVRVFVVDAKLLPKFADSSYLAGLVSRPKRYERRKEMLECIANELQLPTQKSGDTACVWHATVKTRKLSTRLERQIAA